MCDRWRDKLDGFKNFLDDMGPKPDHSYSLDRIDPNGDYCPENCRWADSITQNSNKRGGNKYSKIPGVTKQCGRWVAELGRKRVYAKSEKEAADIRRRLLSEHYSKK